MTALIVFINTVTEVQTYIDYAPYSELVSPTNFTAVGKLDLKQLDRNIYIQYMDAETHKPASIARMQSEKYGKMKFVLKHIDGFVEYSDILNPCTKEDFLGREDDLNREKNFTADSILCPQSPDRLQMLNSFTNHSKSQYLSLEFQRCTGAVPAVAGCEADATEWLRKYYVLVKNGPDSVIVAANMKSEERLVKFATVQPRYHIEKDETTYAINY